MRACIDSLSRLAGRSADSANGTWTGKLVAPQGSDVPGNERIPTSAFPSAKLIVGAASITAQFSGHTLAAHDAPNAQSTCSMQFRFNSVTDGWRLYTQIGRGRVVGASTGGVPDLSPCFNAPGWGAPPAGSQRRQTEGGVRGPLQGLPAVLRAVPGIPSSVRTMGRLSPLASVRGDGVYRRSSAARLSASQSV